MRRQQLRLGGFTALGLALFLGMPGTRAAAQPAGALISNNARLQQYGYITPNPYQASYGYYRGIGNRYPMYNYRSRNRLYSSPAPIGHFGRELPPPPTDPRAYITVRVPADAELWIDDKKVTSGGMFRGFATPPLASGRTRSYEVRARWQKDGQIVTKTRKVEAVAGAFIDLDFKSTDETKK